MKVKIHVTAAGFKGDVSASIRTDELSTFSTELRRLYETLTGSAEFKTMEGQLSLRLTSDAKGHLKLSGELIDGPLQDFRFKFILSFDQTFLLKSIRELENVLAKFPVRKGER